MGVRAIPSAAGVYLGGWLAGCTSIRLVYGLSGGWALLAAVGVRFLSDYRAIPLRTEKGVAEKDE